MTAVPRGQLARHLEALDLAGMALVAKRLLGDDPAAVTGTFARWARSSQRGLPHLTEQCWAALRPIGAGRPALSAAAVVDAVLVGLERDPDVAAAAAAELAAAGRRLFKAAPLPPHGGDAAGLAVDALVDAVKAYWRTLAKAYRQVRPAVVAGDLTAAVATLQATEAEVRDTVERMLVMAHRIAGTQPDASEPALRRADRPVLGTAVSDPVEPPPAARPPVEAATRPAPRPADPVGGTVESPSGAWGAVETGPRPVAPAEPYRPRPADVEVPLQVPGPIRRPADRAARPPRRRPAPSPERDDWDDEVERVPVEVLSTKPPREHPWLPVLFLLIAVGAALVVVYLTITP